MFSIMGSVSYLNNKFVVVLGFVVPSVDQTRRAIQSNPLPAVRCG